MHASNATLGPDFIIQTLVWLLLGTRPDERGVPVTRDFVIRWLKSGTMTSFRAYIYPKLLVSSARACSKSSDTGSEKYFIVHNIRYDRWTNSTTENMP